MEPVLILSAVMMVFFGATQTSRNANAVPAAIPQAPAVIEQAPTVIEQAPAPKKDEQQKPSESSSGWNGKKKFSSKKWK